MARKRRLTPKVTATRKPSGRADERAEERTRLLEAARRRIAEGSQAPDPTFGGRSGWKVPRTESSPGSTVDTVPFGLRVAADYAWRIGVVIIVGAGIFYGASQISTLIIPLMISALLAGLLLPVKRWFEHVVFGRLKHGANGLAVLLTLIAFLIVVGGLITLVVTTMVRGASGLASQAGQGLTQVQHWLNNGPLHMTTNQMQGYLDSAMHGIQQNSSELLRSAAGVGSTVGHVGAGLLLTIFSLIFFLLDGEKIWIWAVRVFPRVARPAADGAGRQGWGSLVAYVRVQLVVALIDAIGIGGVAFFLQVPLVLPLTVLVFLGSFIPIVGAVVTGAVAVLVALVSHGWVAALIMLAGVLAVQQIESHVLQPLIMGRAVNLHPLAVVLVVAGGAMLFGIAGALFAVPVMAVLNSVVKYLASRAWERDPAVTKDIRTVEAATPMPAREDEVQDAGTGGKDLTRSAGDAGTAGDNGARSGKDQE